MPFHIECPWDIDKAEAAWIALRDDMFAARHRARQHAVAFEGVRPKIDQRFEIDLCNWEPVGRDDVADQFKRIAGQLISACHRALRQQGIPNPFDEAAILSEFHAQRIPGRYWTREAQETQDTRNAKRLSIKQVWERIKAVCEPDKIEASAADSIAETLRNRFHSIRNGEPLERRGNTVVLTVSQYWYHLDTHCDQITQSALEALHQGIIAFAGACELAGHPEHAQSLRVASNTFWGDCRRKFVSREKWSLCPLLTLVWYKSKVELLLAPDLVSALQTAMGLAKAA